MMPTITPQALCDTADRYWLLMCNDAPPEQLRAAEDELGVAIEQAKMAGVCLPDDYFERP